MFSRPTGRAFFGGVPPTAASPDFKRPVWSTPSFRLVDQVPRPSGLGVREADPVSTPHIGRALYPRNPPAIGRSDEIRRPVGGRAANRGYRRPGGGPEQMKRRFSVKISFATNDAGVEAPGAGEVMHKLIACALVIATAPAWAADRNELLGAWRVTHGTSAPWAEGATIDKDWIGSRAVFAASAVKARAPLGCGGARYETTSTPPEGLFMGGLETGGAAAAAALGFKAGNVPGVSLACDKGLWEFHLADADSMLFALDDVIWTMSRAHGARAPKSAPESLVQALLERHFSGDKAFTEANDADKRGFLTRSLSGAINDYFGRGLPADEPPPINGDPYTDSQDYPTRFAVRKGEAKARSATVPVDFSDAFAMKRVVFALVREDGSWRIDDLVYEDGGTFKSALAAAD